MVAVKQELETYTQKNGILDLTYRLTEESKRAMMVGHKAKELESLLTDATRRLETEREKAKNAEAHLKVQ